ncbi:MAG: DEAD/DEAH box helicase family protein [Gammaproteobacteria bacterium]|nr:DEAD/DEAH box helicase family protein [Gammaproteobacteria bacterium]MCP5136454.1 DEAD/DEAH box helicase family protein [Gammaproteobacteria bacterium]
MFKLKPYQDDALAALQRFLAAARTGPVADAFADTLAAHAMPAIPYRHYDFGEIPYVCLRLPTGGGKTVLGSHAVEVAAHTYLERDYPLVLWLVPTNTIREQTLEALKTPGHPYRQKLEATFGLDRLRVLDIGDVTQIRPQDLGGKAIVVVGTVATLRVEDTSGRQVYAYHEDFEPHFAGVDPHDPRLERVAEADLKENGLGREALGRIKFSFANLLALHAPLVIMDEAHNARTSLTFATLKRIHPACIVEFTATPDVSNSSGSNVLYHVSAAELKAAEMIKLPVMLTEHQDWQAAVRDAVLTRNKLAIEAQKEADYIRPIVLLQAEARNGAVTVEVLKRHLIDGLNVDEAAIAIATGNQRELTGIDLTARDCPITHIITIEALKEGWDCPFAYVFCSVKDVRSSKDAEQLLGRVLRMPYARRRQVEALNRAYAHLASPHFSQAAQLLADKLINMGFEALEVPSALQRGWSPDLFGDDDGGLTRPQPEPPLVLDLPGLPTLPADMPVGEVRIEATDSGTFRLEAPGLIGVDTTKELLKLFKGTEKKRVQATIEQHNLRQQAARAPSQRGERFAPLPRLCLREQGVLDLLEPENFLYVNGEFSLLDHSVQLPNFTLIETEKTFEVDLNGKRITYRVAEEKEAYGLNQVDGGFTETTLVSELEREVRQADITPREMNRWLALVVGDLIYARGYTLTALVRAKYPLARALRERIALLRAEAAQHGFQTVMFDLDSPLEASLDQRYEFKPGLYPARMPYYRGRFRFAKHYYPVIEDLREGGEEFECAKAIDSHPGVRHWVRNLVKREAASFALPLAGGYFYPDFVAELTDGRLLVVEYKGEPYKSNDDSREKNQVGQRWAAGSGGTCLFLMAVAEDDKGRNVYTQIADVIAGTR